MRKINMFIMLFGLALAFQACNKDEDKVATEADLVGEWNNDNVEIVKAVVFGIDVTNTLGVSADELGVGSTSGETLVINADNTYQINNENGTRDEGTWTLSTDGKVFTTVSDADVTIEYTILTVSADQMKLRLVEDFSDFGIDGAEITAEFTYSK